MREVLVERLRIGLGMIGVAACAAQVMGASRVIYVDKSAPSGGDGTSWQKAFSDLQDAIRLETSFSNDLEIRMAQGTYTPDKGSGDRTKFFGFHYILGSAMTLSLQGSFAGLQGVDPDARDYVSTPTVLSGDLKGDDGAGFKNRTDNSCTIAMIGAQQTLSIDGITVRGASTDGFPEFTWGGGMLAFVQRYGAGGGFTTLRITNCIFEDNDPTNAPAGALSAYADNIEIWYSRFVGNRLQDGGGGAVTLDGIGSLYNCEIDSNVARFGGGVYAKGEAYFSACSVTRNEAEYQGGAVFGPCSANATLFAGNRAGSSGGAIAAYEQLGLISCTVADNVAPSGSAFSVVYGVARLSNVIAWGNSGSSSPIRLVENTFAGWFKNSLLEGGTDAVEMSGVPVTFDGIRSGNPRFLRPRDSAPEFEYWNYRLAAESAAKNIGGDNWVLSDLDGAFYQSKYGAADAGCYFDTRYFCEGATQPLDSIVDDTDFVDFVAAYNLTISPPANPNADFNRDGLVDDADFAIFVIGYDRLFCPLPFGGP